MTTNPKYVTVTDANFQQEVLNSNQPVLVDFWAAWCGPCRMIAPIVEELAREFEGRARVAKMDVDYNPNTAMNFGIRSIPTLLFFQNGRVVDQVVGVAPKKALAERLERLTVAQTA